MTRQAIEVLTPAAAVLPTSAAIGRLTPLGADRVTVKGGLWGQRLKVNRERTIPHGFAQLDRAGNLANFRLAAGVKGRYRTLNEAVGVIYPFLDTDVYKWLEAAAWELGRRTDRALAKQADEAIGLVTNAQRDDGYLNTYVQVVAPGGEYRDLAWGHELYCFGHLIQAAVAWRRALGDDRLLKVAERTVDSIERQVEATGGVVLDGHPEIEMALVELYRTTGERRHLDLAARMIEARGEGRIGTGRFGSAYWQDHARVRDATAVAGHAVRQLYLDCGAVDVATELGDRELLDAVIRRWHDMVATRMYLTGGLGSRHLDEAFGDPFELPPDRAYAETCASIASAMLAWRLLLATGDPEFADVIERTVYNGILPGVSLEGTGFFYVNTLQRRTERTAEAPGHGERQPWYPCACCPPNVMRFLSSWPQYVATADADGVQIHQYATAEVRASVAGGTVRVATKSSYPWDGTLNLTVLETPEQPWTLSVRIPAWCRSATLRNTAGRRERVVSGLRQVSETRTWQAGDSIVITLDMPVRVTAPDARLDASRGCVALERGPLVYCIESVDLPPGVGLEEVELESSVRPVAVPRPDLADDVVGIAVPAVQRGPGGGSTPADSWTSVEVDAVPYFTWANRAVGAMRIWIPVRSGPAIESPAGEVAG